MKMSYSGPRRPHPGETDPGSLVRPLDRALHLRTVPLLAGLGASDLALLAQSARERSFPAGSHLLRAGEQVDAFYLVVDGRVRVAMPGFESRLGPGQAVGLLSFLARSPEGVEAVAEVDTLCLEFDADVMLDLFEDHFSLVLAQIRYLAQRTLAERRETPADAYLAPWPRPLDEDDRDLDLVERMVILRRTSPFWRTSLSALAEIARQMDQVTYPPATHLWKAGDSSADILVIASGTVACDIAGGGTRFRCGPGYPLGNLESLAGEPRWYDATCLTRVVGMRSRTEVLLDLLEDHFEMAMDFLAAMAGNLLKQIRGRGESTGYP